MGSTPKGGAARLSRICGPSARGPSERPCRGLVKGRSVRARPSLCPRRPAPRHSASRRTGLGAGAGVRRDGRRGPLRVGTRNRAASGSTQAPDGLSPSDGPAIWRPAGRRDSTGPGVGGPAALTCRRSGPAAADCERDYSPRLRLGCCRQLSAPSPSEPACIGLSIRVTVVVIIRPATPRRAGHGFARTPRAPSLRPPSSRCGGRPPAGDSADSGSRGRRAAAGPDSDRQRRALAAPHSGP